MSPTLQSVINFPVRKTRSSSKTLENLKNKNGLSSTEAPNTKSSLSSPNKRTQNDIPITCSPPKLKKVSSKPCRVSKRIDYDCTDENLPPSFSEGATCTRPSYSPVKKDKSIFETKASPLKSSNQSQLKCSIAKKDLQIYQKLKHSFASSHCSQLVGRESQMNILKEFLSSHICKGLPGAIYISGAPGTGKTASVSTLIKTLELPKMKIIFLNCMAQKSSSDIFTHIAVNLGLQPSKRELRSSIEHAFSTSKVPILLVLDEVDQLESKNQEVLYTIFEWPSLAKSKLVLVGIANMLDLTDRILPRLQANSSCRPQLLHFPPYSKTEIVSIIKDRIKEADLGDTEIFKPASINFLAGKISAVAGDIRKALDVCRRAVELCEIKMKNKLQSNATDGQSSQKNSSSPQQIDIPLLLIIFNEIFGSRVTPSITNCQSEFPLQQKVLLATLVLILKNGKVQDVTVGQFHEVYSRVCRTQKLAVIEQGEFFSICSLLESRGLLQIKTHKEPRNSKIISRIDQEEAEQTLGDKFLLSTILNDIGSLGKLARKKK